MWNAVQQFTILCGPFVIAAGISAVSTVFAFLASKGLPLYGSAIKESKPLIWDILFEDKFRQNLF
jgi:hypothetical protein